MTAPEGPARSRAAVTRILVALALATALAPLSVDIYTPSLPAMQAELGGADWLAQASITACLLGIGFGQLICGPLSDRFGRRPVVLVGLVGWAVAAGLSALATSPGMLVAIRVVVGVCGAAGIVVARSIVRDISSDRQSVSSRVGLLSMVTAIAPIVAPIAGAGIAAAWGWRADFVVLACLGGVLASAFALVVPETLPRRRREQGGAATIASALRRAVEDRELFGIAIAMAAFSFGFYAYIAAAAFIVERQFQYPAWVFAVVFGTNAIAMLAGNLVFRRVVRRRHPSVPVGIGLATGVVAGTSMLVASLADSPGWVVWAISTVFAASAGFVLPGTHAWGQLTAVVSGAASAITGSAQFFGGVLGSPATGIVGTSSTGLGAILAVSSAIGIVAWAGARKRVRSTRE